MKLGTECHPLTQEEQNKLIEAWQKRRCVRSRNALVNSYLKLIRSIALDHNPKRCELDDLINEGVLGLIEAIDRFELERGLKLCTYAHYWIVMRIRKYMGDNIGAVRVATARTLYCVAKKGGLEAVQAQRKNELLGISLANAVTGRGVISMDKPLSNKHGELSGRVGDRFPSQTTPPDEEAHINLAAARVREALESLPDRRTAHAFEQAYLHGKTWPVIGKSLGVSKTRAQQYALIALYQVRALLGVEIADALESRRETNRLATKRLRGSEFARAHQRARQKAASELRSAANG